MLAGDSITQGRDGDYTWRYRFDRELQRQHVTDVSLVGPKKYPRSYGSKYPHYLVGSGWETDHDATSGTTLHYQLGLIKQDMEAATPDILVSYLGTNDFLRVPEENPGVTGADLMAAYEQKITQAIDDWGTYVDTVRSVDPNEKIVLGELVSPNIPQSIRDDYNSKLATFATNKAGIGVGAPSIVVAQLAGSLWSSSDYLYDGVHPTPTAETFLAQRFAESVNEVSPGLFPGPITIQQDHVVPWDPPLTAKVKIARGRIHLDWSFALAYNSATQMRVKLINLRTMKARILPFQTAARWTSPKLPAGHYRYRLQAARVRMHSLWSPAYAVKVPAYPQVAAQS